MQKSKLIRTRKGFTLVEVALAVAVGLIIIGGAVLGYNAVKDNASNSNARNRVLSAVTMIEEYSAANGGRYPASLLAGGPFTTMWGAKRPDDKNLSPWGGSTGGATGVAEITASAFTTASQPAAATEVWVEPTGAGQAANMIYVSNTTPATPWVGITASSTQSVYAAKNYAVGIYDKGGAAPWWDVKGGK